MNKKSYMSGKNIIEESFFKKLAGILRLAKTSKAKKTKSTDDKLNKNLKDVNDSISNLEKSFEDLYGKKFNFARMTIDDLKKDLRV